jgi:hypothetical protein
MGIGHDQRCQITIKDRFKHGAHLIQAQMPRVRLWKLESQKLVYIAVPKVGSSSIRNLLRLQQVSEILDMLGDTSLSSSDLKSLAEKQLKVKLRPTRVLQMAGEYYRFSFVRNPLARLYSCYRDKVVNAQNRRKRCTLRTYGMYFGMSFDEFIKRVSELPDSYSDQHFRSQSALLSYKGELFVDYWGKLERFTDDWAPISSQFNLDVPSRSRRVSGEAIPLCELPLTRQSLELVMKRFEEDLDLFDYRRELEALWDQFPRS